MSEDDAKTRHLVLHDYGMGGAWWWIHARSAQEVLETFAWVEIVSDPETLDRMAEDQDLEEVDVDVLPMPPGLDELRAERDAQRGRPGFGALAGRDVVRLRRLGLTDGDEERTVHLLEVDATGRRIRQVEHVEDGTALRSTPDDWVFNTPVVDLYDPATTELEISAEEFEAEWARAVPVESDESEE